MSIIYKNIKLIISDIDGVLTNGTKGYNNTGKGILKFFSDKDFTAIKLFQKNKIFFCLLSADKNINLNLCKNRNFPFFFGRNKKGKIIKEIIIKKIMKKYKISNNNTCYIGDDIFDIAPAKLVKYRACPINAVKELKKICNIQLNTMGGDGVIKEFFDRVFKNKKNIIFPVI